MPRRQTLFWDVNPATINPDENATYVIERILDFGYDDEVKWMAHYYPPEVIREVAESSRVLSAMSKNLWVAVFGGKIKERESRTPIHCRTCRCFVKREAFLKERRVAV